MIGPGEPWSHEVGSHSILRNLVGERITMPSKPSARRLAARYLRTAKVTAPEPFDTIIYDEVEDALDDLSQSYEAYTEKMIDVGGRGFRFGSGSDGGYGGEAYTMLSYISGSGGWPKDSALSKMLQDAEYKAYAYARDQWIDQNLGWLEENGIPHGEVNYNELYDRGHGYEAEELSEMENEVMGSEDITLRIGAFYYGPDNRREGSMGEHNMYVFSLLEYDGHFAPSKSYTVFETTFAFEGPRDLQSKLKRALAQAVSALE